MSKQFIVRKFKQYVANIEIFIKNISVEAHYFMRLIENYYNYFVKFIILSLLNFLKLSISLS